MKDLKNMNEEELQEYLSGIFMDRAPEEKRSTIMHTGKGGAILWHVELYKQFNDDEEKIENYKKNLEDTMEPGMYKIDEKGCEYIGLYDNEMPNGIHGIKANGKFYIERWVDGFRSDYKIVSEEEFEDIKKNGLPKT